MAAVGEPEPRRVGTWKDAEVLARDWIGDRSAAPQSAAEATTDMSPTRTDSETRRARVNDAVHSGRLEGQEPTAECLADADASIIGGINDDEMIARGRRRWGLET